MTEETGGEAGAGERATAFGARLRGHRRAAGLTQEALAERAGLSRRGLQHLEAGDARPYPATLDALAAALGLAPEDGARLRAAARAAPPPAADGAPGRSLAPPPHNLPLQLTSFVGRERALADVTGGLAADRLVTLTGAGGTGKTRLALRAAAELLGEYPDGVWLVELAALADPALVPQAVASAVGVREEPGRPLLATLTDALKPQRLLLVLDNCEHLLEASARLADALLRACPHLSILATSREALGIAGETPWRVPSLSVPELRRGLPPETLAQAEAVRLFVHRAVTAKQDFVLTERTAPAVAQICVRLDGIPLALELAAARVRVLPAEQLLGRLEDRFRLLTGGSRTAPARHQTLRAAVDWSYALLSDPERTLFARLSVFAGGWTLEAAEAVCADPDGAGIAPGEVLDLLTRLADKSLVVAEEQPDGTARYRLLETLRQYARERLAAGGAAALRERHAAHYLERAEAGPAGPGSYRFGEVVVRAVAEAWEREGDNARAALAWWLERGEAERGLRLVTALNASWQIGGRHGEALRWLDALLAAGPVPAPVRAGALNWAGYHAHQQGDYERARALHEASVALWREAGDPRELSVALTALGLVHCLQGDLARAEALIRESLILARGAGDGAGVSRGLRDLGHVARAAGDYPRAQALLEESLAAAQAAGHSWEVWRSSTCLARVAFLQGRHGEAAVRLREALTGLQDIARPVIAVADALEWLAAAVAAAGRAERAARLYGAAARLRRDAGGARYAPDRPAYERDVAETRAQLSRPAFAAAWAAGDAMTLEEAVADALADEPDTA
jgi:non-specific serine/threonine protein kinase